MFQSSKILKRRFEFSLIGDASFFRDEWHAKKSGIILKDHSKEEFNVIVEQDDEGFLVASAVELPGCHTQAKSVDNLMKRLREAVDLYLEVEGHPETPSRFVGTLRIPTQ